MSQNILNTASASGPVQLIVGWDRRLQELFCNVMPLDDDDEGDYSEFFLSPSLGSVEEIKELLQNAGITVPDTLLQAVATDQAHNAGNVMRRFSADGLIEQETVF